MEAEASSRRRRIPHLAGLALSLALAGCGTGGEAPAGVVLVIVDTLRADRLGCSGHPGARTPALDRLARAGAQFRETLSHVPVTAPSVATILTGTLPPHHGVRDNGFFVLGDSPATLAEVFARAGWETAAFVSAAVLERTYGFDRGYGTYDDDLSAPFAFHRADLAPIEAEHQNVERRGADTTERAAAWLGAIAGTPCFLTVHLFDPHDPYDPPPPSHAATVAQLYDGEVTAADACVEQLLHALAETGRLDRTWVTVVADHGEGLGEHGESVHGFFVYDSTLRVPWLVRGPGLEGGRIIARGAKLADVAPTLLGLAGLGGAFGQGESRAGELRSGIPTADTQAGGGVYLETFRTLTSYGWSELVGLRTGRWKLIRAPRPELYDLASDPRELANLHGSLPDTVRALSGELDLLIAASARADAPAPSPIDDETRRRLEALGYLSAGTEPAAPTGARIDPKDGVAAFDRRQRAKELVVAGRAFAAGGRPDEAKAALAEAVELAPDYGPVWYELGQVQRGLGDDATAERSFARAVELDPSLVRAWTVRGLLAYAGRRDSLAHECFRAAWERAPAPWTRQNLFEFLLRTGRFDEAVRFAGEAAARDPSDLWPRHAHAFALGRAGRTAEEAGYLKSALPAGDATARFRLTELAGGGARPADLGAAMQQLNATAGVFRGYRAPLWLDVARHAARAGQPDAEAYYTKALDDSYGAEWEDEAVAGGGRLIMKRR
ncbi:MAG: sulfatase-like hydrolase/transferase [Candidatus Eiseniibacteriota bacterium]